MADEDELFDNEFDSESENLITDGDIIMKGGAGAPVPGAGAPAAAPAVAPAVAPVVQNYNVRDQINERLLQILDNGINQIVMQIKAKLGNNIPTTNTSAKRIVEMLEGIVTTITPTLDALSTLDPDGNRVLVTKAGNAQNLYTATTQNNYINLDNTVPDENTLLEFKRDGKYTDRGFGLSRFGHNSYINIETLDSVVDNATSPTPILGPPGTIDPVVIQRRLNNCQYLEILYLIKHEELMKTFAFTLNLFDKYKYSIKILLFVLKNLVKKQPVPLGPGPGPFPPGPGVPPTIRLPKPLIPKIWKLLQDQKKVQEVITTMQETLDESKDNYHVGTTITPKLYTGAERPDAKLSSLSRQTAPAGVLTKVDFDVENKRSPPIAGLTASDASANSPSPAKYPLLPADNL